MRKANLSPERLRQILLRYIENYGQGWIGYYSFNGCSRSAFISFMDSLRITLTRMNMIPAYIWQYDPTCDRYELFLFTNGYFRSGMEDLSPVMVRLWSLRSTMPFQLHESVFADRKNLVDVQKQIAELAEPWQSYPTASCYRRSFGSSAQNSGHYR